MRAGKPDPRVSGSCGRLASFPFRSLASGTAFRGCSTRQPRLRLYCWVGFLRVMFLKISLLLLFIGFPFCFREQASSCDVKRRPYHEEKAVLREALGRCQSVFYVCSKASMINRCPVVERRGMTGHDDAGPVPALVSATGSSTDRPDRLLLP
jgi:hypothetical protein